jgi:hypothetical protein
MHDLHHVIVFFFFFSHFLKNHVNKINPEASLAGGSEHKKKLRFPSITVCKRYAQVLQVSWE